MAHELPSDFPDRVKQLRERLDLTQEQLAELLGVSFASVNRWENRQSRPSKSSWQKFLRAEAMGAEALRREKPEPQQLREEEKSYEVEPKAPPPIDFSGNPEAVWAVAEGHRLGYGYLFNPTFATEISLIDPLPHQRLAVYKRMLPQFRLRFLLADDAGAGKTIMAGLYIREMLARRLIHRVLIVPPAGLVGNWQRELHTLFNLPFQIASGSDAKLGNPFVGPESHLLIVSVDTLARDRMFSRLQEQDVAQYDLVVFDEAHKLSAHREPDRTIRKTDRYRLAEALAGAGNENKRWNLDWHCHHLLLLTATPHMGKDYPYYRLWKLLEPEVLSTYDAFQAYPKRARRWHFIRRVKEEILDFEGNPVYPTRISDTLSYDLNKGDISEQRLYDETTAYIRTFYNQARILNRSAARFAMSIFQRRLASSTYALMRSFERRLAKLEGLIDDIQSGRLDEERLVKLQRRIEVRDVLEEMTADEEEAEAGLEESELAEEKGLVGVVAKTLAELEAERLQVERLLDLARRVYEDPREESKFAKLHEILEDEDYKDEKMIIFTEYRDTLDFLVRRLEGVGFTGQVAQIHGGMDWQQREDQVAFFKRAIYEGGARYLVATDAAGEGINLQFAWLMVNYDIPWNPARLEQRMGRIHRYKQEHDPVIILNLVAGQTREGRVLKVLLDKLERIRRELGSDKVFDVIGRIFKEVSIKAYMERAVIEEDDDGVEQEVDEIVTKEEVAEIEERERQIYGDDGHVRDALPHLKAELDRQVYVKLLPGYVRRFIERATPLVGIEIEGNLEGIFSFRSGKPGALDPLWSTMETYSMAQVNRLTVHTPETADPAIWLHPGEPLFDRLQDHICTKLAREALKGGIFVDPTATSPYLFHLALVTVERQADPDLPALAQAETLEYRLVGLKQEEGGQIEACPVEHLLLLRSGQTIPPAAIHFAATVNESRDFAEAYALERSARVLADDRRQAILATLPEREDLLRRGYDYQEAELAAARAQITEKAQSGDPRAKGELTKIKGRQRALAARRKEALATLTREPELIAPGEVTFLTHVLVVPSTDPEDRKRHDRVVEMKAMEVARAHEEARGATVQNVSTPELAIRSGLTEYPGFDLLSVGPDGEKRAIEVKGRARIGDVEISENEWIRAGNIQDGYWLYVVYDCATSEPRLLRIQNPYENVPFRPKGGVIIEERDVFYVAEYDD